MRIKGRWLLNEQKHKNDKGEYNSDHALHTNSLVLYEGQIGSNGEKPPECMAYMTGLSGAEWKSKNALVLASY